MRKGFTLIEMLVVVAIIVALLAIIGFAGPALTRGSKVNAYKGTVKNMATALDVVLQNTGAAPATAADAMTAMKPYISGDLSNPFVTGGHVYLGTKIIDPVGAPSAGGADTEATVKYTVTTDSIDGVTVPGFKLEYTVGGDPGSYVSSNSTTAH
jgi:prepilin-type N-terminal cleavage/methylation domain-containing protein